ncbi:NAD(P)H-dependent glycerol-3-phosphate dehydrogenase [Cognatiluteimonas profundi]|uniref:NAD(P)H-dependent glycerol-3-phosphate dehydrogenase n=1 Tax=Cognatiluteimonas profundi TaxID=2594501 RepID=UPI00131DC3BC|nr:NAD(P)H-dependent glycerol-3-phosphate dehydrogenase [Lysobacter profundi]
MAAPVTRSVAVLGAGSWGTALAALIARHGHRPILWGRDRDVVEAIDARHENPHYLPGIRLPDTLRATTDLATAMHGADLVLVVVPSHAFTETLRALAPYRPAHAGVAWATKGFEPGSGRFLHEVAAEVLGPDVPLAVVTGPSFAKEVAAGLPTALTVHSDDAAFAQAVANVLHGPTFRVYTGSDMRGAELGGAMKNVLAVATGAADGMNLGLNARTGLITRGLNEMLRLNAAIGGRAETLMGLAGLGDLVLTCTGELSRNRRLGLALGRGQSIADAVREIGQVVESIQTVDEVMRQAARHGIELPISSVVQSVLHGEMTPEQAMQNLLAREQKAEYPVDEAG